MTWWARLAAEVRSLWTPNVPSAALVAPFTSSGEPVSVQRAVGLSAVWSCVALIAGSISSMPCVLYRRTEAGREKAIEHPLYDVLKLRPNPIQPAVQFWESLVTSLLLTGNGYAMLTKPAGCATG
jgi:phage portal protein BeeE